MREYTGEQTVKNWKETSRTDTSHTENPRVAGSTPAPGTKHAASKIL